MVYRQSGEAMTARGTFADRICPVSGTLPGALPSGWVRGKETWPLASSGGTFSAFWWAPKNTTRVNAVSSGAKGAGDAADIA